MRWMKNNGTLSVLPGRHKKGLLSQVTLQGDFFGYSIDSTELGEEPQQREVVYRLRAGQAATHSSYLPHRSTANRSEAWRRAMTCHFMRADADEMGRTTL